MNAENVPLPPLSHTIVQRDVQGWEVGKYKTQISIAALIQMLGTALAWPTVLVLPPIYTKVMHARWVAASGEDPHQHPRLLIPRLWNVSMERHLQVKHAKKHAIMELIAVALRELVHVMDSQARLPRMAAVWVVGHANMLGLI